MDRRDTSNELTKAGHTVVGLERGEYRNTNPDFAIPGVHDELAYVIRYKLLQDASKETLSRSVRTGTQTALPVRQWVRFCPATVWVARACTGTASLGACRGFRNAQLVDQRYGAGILGDDCTSADWGITYDELEPYYDRFEYLAGIAGKAGNIKGAIQPGGNPFEGSRSRDYPSPPQKQSYAMAVFGDAVQKLGYHPFPQPRFGEFESSYTNPEGVELGLCVYCSYCERFACEMGAKASMQTTLLPGLAKRSNF